MLSSFNLVNPSREFFAIEAYQAVAIINAFPGIDLTPQAERAAEQAVERNEPGTMAAVRNFERKRRPPLNFLEMGIPIARRPHRALSVQGECRASR
jgi:hypothetical protein